MTEKEANSIKKMCQENLKYGFKHTEGTPGGFFLTSDKAETDRLLRFLDEALSKQIPRQIVLKIEENGSVSGYKCPCSNCGNKIKRLKNVRYCSACGQRVSWGSTGEKETEVQV